jgi:serine protease Do
MKYYSTYLRPILSSRALCARSMGPAHKAREDGSCAREDGSYAREDGSYVRYDGSYVRYEESRISKVVICYLKLIILSFTLFCSNSYANPNEFPSLAPVLKKAMPAVVNIAVQGIIPDGITEKERAIHPDRKPPHKFQGMGSGVILNAKDGIIITNSHVIKHAQVITVTLNDGRRVKAKLIGEDAESDVAVLKVDAKNLPNMPQGDSDKIEVGDFVVAIGNPFGLNSFGNNQSATFGIISATRRSQLNLEGIENFIQTDAAINPGNSGGALINTKGEVIGINTAIISLHGGNVGIGFAIPINMVKDITAQIMKYGSVHRGLMGIYVQHLTPEIAQALGYKEDLTGALVAQVNKNSPADKAGIKSGDVIIEVNNTKINEASQVKNVTSLLRVGATVEITLVRNGKKLKLKSIVTDIKKHEQTLQLENPFLYGLAFKNIEEDTPANGHIAGVQIIGAMESSAGWRAGLRPGDIIITANTKPVATTDELKNIASQKKEQLLLQVLRDNGALFILVV